MQLIVKSAELGTEGAPGVARSVDDPRGPRRGSGAAPGVRQERGAGLLGADRANDVANGEGLAVEPAVLLMDSQAVLADDLRTLDVQATKGTIR